MRRPVAALVPLVAAAAVAVAARSHAPAPPLVVISIDGLRPGDVLESASRGLRLPNLTRLVAEGTHAKAVTGVLPTVTYPSHVTLVTGVSPSRHGIFANSPFELANRGRSDWYWYAEDIRVPTLWDQASAAGLITSAVDWPVTVGANIRYNIVQYWRGDLSGAGGDAKLERALSTPPGLLAEAERAIGPYPAGRAFSVTDDRRRTSFNVYLLETKKPGLHFCYFSGLDEAEHASGPGSAASREALETIDGLVGSVRAAAEVAGGGRARLAVVSDHGFAETRREFNLVEALHLAGLLPFNAAGLPADDRVSVWNSGGSAAVLLRDRGDVKARQAIAAFLDRLVSTPDSPIARVLSGEEARREGGFPTADFVVAMRSDACISDRLDGTIERRVHEGTHGLLPSEESMAASFFMAGPGIPAGRDLGTIDMRDVAPTLAAMLGIALPDADGHDLLHTP